NTVLRLFTALNPEAAGGKVDLNFRGREVVADLLYQADPDRKGTNPDAHKYYESVAQNVINKRSELGLFHNMQQVLSVPGVDTGIAGVLNAKTFLGSFNVLNQETVGPQVGRELQLKTRMTFEEQLNLAMNQTLSRTILTSGSVVIVLVALILFGGKVIHEFAWILLIGVLAGTYSTITIVPAVAIAWNKLTGRQQDMSGPATRVRVEAVPPRVEPSQRKRK